MHVRINDVTVSPGRVDELAEVLSNKALPVVLSEKGNRGLLCAAERATGRCNIVSFWDSRHSLDASEDTISRLRADTLDVVDGELNSVTVAEVLRAISGRPTKVGARTRVVRLTGPAGSSDQMLEFYDREATPRLESQPGFLSSRLIHVVDDERRFLAVSHWADADALDTSDRISATLRQKVAEAVPGTTIEGVSTAEIVLVHLTT